MNVPHIKIGFTDLVKEKSLITYENIGQYGTQSLAIATPSVWVYIILLKLN